MRVDDHDEYFRSLFKIDTLEENAMSAIYRCSPPYVNSAVDGQPSRTYGGEAISYSYLAAKLFLIALQHQKISPTFMFINFLSAGDCHTPMEMHVRKHSETKVFVEVKKNGKTLTRSYIKKSILLGEHFDHISKVRRLIEYIPSPHKCFVPNLYLISKMDLFAWKQHTDVHGCVMDARLVEYGSTFNDESHSIMWVRIPADQRENTGIIDSDTLLVYLSDYYIVQSIANHLRKNKRYFKTVASLNHVINLLQTNLNPFQWFLIHSSIQSLNNDKAIMNVVIFSEQKIPVLYGRQEMYAPSRLGTPKLKIDSERPGSKI